MYGIETLHEHRASLEQKDRFSGFPCKLDRSWRADVLYAQSLNGDRLKDVPAIKSSVLPFLARSGQLCRRPAAPDSRAAAMIYESVNGQVIVTSQHNALPFDQGTSVRPSGRLPSDLNRPDGSLVTGKPAKETARAIRSLRA